MAPPRPPQEKKHLNLPCLYYKHDSSAFSECSDKVFDDECRLRYAIVRVWSHFTNDADCPKEHLKEHHLISTYFCRLCAQGFGSQRYLSRHVCKTTPASVNPENIDRIIIERETSDFGRLTSDMKAGNGASFNGYDRDRVFDRCRTHRHVMIHGTSKFGTTLRLW